jgi:hypothetical protein
LPGGWVSVPLSFKVGPVPHVKPPRKPPVKAPKNKVVPAPKQVVQVQQHPVQAHQSVTASGSNGHLVHQAVHTLVESRLFKKKGL